MKNAGTKEAYKTRGPLRASASAVYPRSNRESESSPALHPYWRFLVAGFNRYSQTGGVVPSQRFLISRMISAVPADYRGQLVELGPGTGVLTVRLAERCPKAEILACEINPELAEVVRERIRLEDIDDRVKVISQPAEQLLSVLARDTNRPGPEYIISGIPLGNLARASAIALIELIHGALVPGGQYIQFQHSLLDHKKIKTRFSRMRTVPVLLNFPPAFVYYAWK